MKPWLVAWAAVIAFGLVSLVLSQGPQRAEESKLVDRFPFAVSLQDPNRNHKCGGSIIRLGWIATAAQCVSPLTKNSLGMQLFIIKINEADTAATLRKLPQETFPIKTFIHPEFDGNPQNGFDIALIYVGENLKQEPLRTAQTVLTLSKGDELLNLARGIGEDFSSEIRVIRTSSLSPDTCNSVEPGWNGGMKCGMMCVSVPPKGYCRGEAGTPLIFADYPIDLSKGNPSFDVLVGISSFGEAECKSNSKPAVFTQVSDFLDWINETIGSAEEGELAQPKVSDDEEPPKVSSLNTQCRATSITTAPQPIAEVYDPPEQEPASESRPPRCTSGCEELNKRLWTAAENGVASKTERLLAQGADPDSIDDDDWDRTPLHKAAREGNVDVAKALLDAGASIDVQDDRGETALIEASRYGHAGIMGLLLDAGASIDVQNDNGNTALIRASEDGHADVVGLLLDAGASIDVQDNDGETALSRASLYGHAAVVGLLLDAGASIDVQDNNGYTALIKASLSGDAAVVGLLLDAGASTTIKTDGGETALHVARRLGKTDMVALLTSDR